MTSPGQPVWSYKTIHVLWLLLLDLGICRKGQTVCQGWFLLAPGLVAGQLKSEGTSRSAYTYLHLLTTCQAQPLKDPLVVLKLHDVGSQ